MSDDVEADRAPRWDEDTQRYLYWDAEAGAWTAKPTPPVTAEPYWDEERQRYATEHQAHGVHHTARTALDGQPCPRGSSSSTSPKG